MQSMVKSSHTSQKLKSQKFVLEAFPEIRKYFNSQNKPAIRYYMLLYVLYIVYMYVYNTDL